MDAVSSVKSVIQSEKGQNLSLLAVFVKDILCTGMPGFNRNKVSTERSEFKIEIKAQYREGKEELRSKKNSYGQRSMFLSARFYWE